MEKEVKLGIRMDTWLHHKLKIEAVARRVTLRELCTEYIVKGLGELEKMIADDQVEVEQVEVEQVEVEQVGVEQVGVEQVGVGQVGVGQVGVEQVQVEQINIFRDKNLRKSEQHTSELQSILDLYSGTSQIGILRSEGYLAKWVILFDLHSRCPMKNREYPKDIILEMNWEYSDHPRSQLWMQISAKSKLIWAIDTEKKRQILSALSKWSQSSIIEV